MARITLFKWVWFSTSTSTAPNTAPSRVASSAERMLVPDSLMAVQMSAYRPRRSSPPTASRTTNVSPSDSCQSMSMRRSASVESTSRLGQSERWIEMPRPCVTYPTTWSPGTGWQHWAYRTISPSTPWILMPRPRRSRWITRPKPTAFGRVIQRLRLGRGIRIQGVDGLMVRYAQCCQPVPGDQVVGYVTQGRGISIHRSDCPNLLVLSTEAERRIDIDWQESEGETFVVRLAVGGEDRRGLYADICTAISESGTNIRSAELATRDGAVFGAVLVEVENQTHLNKVIRAIRRVKGVTDVSRRESGPQVQPQVG